MSEAATDKGDSFSLWRCGLPHRCAGCRRVAWRPWWMRGRWWHARCADETVLQGSGRADG